MCCNYGADGKKIIATKGGYDCIMIPGAQKASDSALKSPKICGSKMGLITATGTTSATVCCKLDSNQTKISHSAYDATSTESNGAKIDGFLYRNFTKNPKK